MFEASSDTTFQDWLQDPEKKVLVFTGSNGSGKSRALQYIFEINIPNTFKMLVKFGCETIKIDYENNTPVAVKIFGDWLKIMDYISQKDKLKELEKFLDRNGKVFGFDYNIKPKFPWINNSYFNSWSFENISKNVYLKFHHLSSGERSIFMILLWKFLVEEKLAMDDKDKIIMLLDEPDSFLHQNAIENFMSIIKNDIIGKYDIRMIISTHNVLTVSYFEDDEVFAVTKNSNNIQLNKYDYSLANQMISTMIYARFAKKHINNVKLFEELIQTLNKGMNKNYGYEVEHLVKLYLRDSKSDKKKIEFFNSLYKNNKITYLNFKDDNDDLTQINFRRIDLKDNKITIIWPKKGNFAFDFSTIHKNDSKIIVGFYQITVQTDYTTKINDSISTYTEHYNIFRVKDEDNNIIVRYFLIHGNTSPKNRFKNNEMSLYPHDDPKKEDFSLISINYFGDLFQSDFMKSFKK